MAGETSYSCYRFRLCVRGVASVLSAAAKWTSQAIVTPAESVQWQGLERTLTALRVLDMEVSVDRGAAYLICLLKSLARPRCWKNIFVLLRMSWIN